MKIGRIERATPDGLEPRLVVVLADERRVVDIAAAEGLRLRAAGANAAAARSVARTVFPGSLAAALQLGDRALLEAIGLAVQAAGDDASLEFDGLAWLPATDPPVLRDCIAFVAHMQNYYDKIGHELSPIHYQQPGYYKAGTGCLFGHGREIPWPGYSEFIDYELEIGFVVGRRGRNLLPEEAADHIFGITVFNDYSARDYQREEMTIGMGPTKSKDFAYGIGPWITTTDEIQDFQDLEMIARVNGEEWSRGLSDGMQWSPEELLAYISLADQAQPGDLFGSGTVGGGSTLELDRRLKPGDEVELEITGVGALAQRLSQPEDVRWMPTPRPRPEPVRI